MYKDRVLPTNGDIFHGNPSMYSEKDTPNPYNKSLTTEEIWAYDKQKVDFLVEKGYNVKIVWEKDFKENKTKVIEECKAFLEG